MSDFLFFVAGAASIAGQGLDIITTNAGLATGGKELNPVVAWALKKIGFIGVAAFKIVGIAILPAVVFYELGHPTAGAFVALVSAGVGFYAGIANYIALKKAGVKVF